MVLELCNLSQISSRREVISVFSLVLRKCKKPLQFASFRPGLEYSSYYRCTHSILLIQKGNYTVVGSGHCLASRVPTCWLEGMLGGSLEQFWAFSYVAVVHCDLLCYYGIVINILKNLDQYLISSCYWIEVCVCCWWFGFVCLFFQKCFFFSSVISSCNRQHKNGADHPRGTAFLHESS